MHSELNLENSRFRAFYSVVSRRAEYNTSNFSLLCFFFHFLLVLSFIEVYVRAYLIECWLPFDKSLKNGVRKI